MHYVQYILHGQRKIYPLIVVVAVGLGVAIAGLPNRTHDAPLRIVVTTTTTPSSATTTAPAG